MDEGQMNRIETRAVFLHPALASRPETEKIASKHKTRFVARKIAKLMFHSITQLADSATNLPSPNDERKSASRRRGKEGKRVPWTQTPLISVPPSFIANFEQRRYYKYELVGVSLLGNHVQKSPEEEGIEIAHSMSHATSSPVLGHPAAHQCRSFSTGIPLF